MLKKIEKENITRRKIEEIIFLGAGASMSEGAPSQKDLLREYFKSICISDIKKKNRMEQRLSDFFRSFFGIDIKSEIVKESNLENVSFPTFEEVLGVIEFALNRQESFKDYSLILKDNNLHQIREDLIFLIAITLKKKLHVRNIHHTNLINRLKREKKILKTAFVSLNYDILIDNALMDCAPDNDESKRKFDLDYGVEFTNFELKDTWDAPRPEKAVYLYKLHGSLNWLYCPTCTSLTLTPKEKKVATLIYKPVKCKDCETEMIPIIIPPTFLKVMSNPFLQEIWHKTEMALKQAKRIIFCGYSFPEADIHIKYLLKRTEMNKNKDIEVYIINNHENKSDKEKNDEELRYKRFFKNKAKVKYLKDKSFQNFCEMGLPYPTFNEILDNLH